MKHDWEYGHREDKRNGFNDRCKKCGVIRHSGIHASYIPSEQVTRFLTTYKPVDFYDYILCKGG